MRLSLLPVLAAALATAACSQQQPPICTAVYAFGLTVTALDASTGDSLRVEPSGLVRDGSFSDSMTVLGNRLMGAGERAGTYEIAVSAPGYTPWDTSGIVVTADECHVHGVSLTATLQPQA